MKRIRDTIAGEPLSFYYIESADDCARAARFAKRHKVLALDTESTGLDCYVPGWEMRTFQFGNRDTSIVVPARFKRLIAAIMLMDIEWIGHNGPHDIRCLDKFLGSRTGVVCAHETYIYAHHHDPRKRKDGGTGHGLKELSCAHIDPQADKWERALKAAFKEIKVPLPGEVYKSGTNRGMPKMRKIKLSEGWALIDPEHPAYIAYAAGDPVLTYRLWEIAEEEGWRVDERKLYARDLKIQQICDTLHRRGLPVDVRYNRRYSAALDKAINRAQAELASRHGITSIYSTGPLAERFMVLGEELNARTRTGNYQVDTKVLKSLAASENARVSKLAVTVLRAKQRTKRKKVYADGMYNALDRRNRVHPSINSLAARTGRMSAGIFQQLPTKDETA